MKLASSAGRRTTISTSPPAMPRLRLEPTRSPQAVLDGGWWPRSTELAAELPGLVLAIDELHGPIDRLVVNADGWDSRPPRIGFADRVLRLGYFVSQPVSLLTALCANGDRVDLLVVPPDTERGRAERAMAVAATTGNHIHAPDILPGIAGGTASAGTREQVWDDDGGQSPAGRVRVA